MTVENDAIWRQADQSIGNGDVVELSCLQVSDEDVRSPQTIELVVIQCDAGVKKNVELRHH